MNLRNGGKSVFKKAFLYSRNMLLLEQAKVKKIWNETTHKQLIEKQLGVYIAESFSVNNVRNK